jgi:hypothetical protein
MKRRKVLDQSKIALALRMEAGQLGGVDYDVPGRFYAPVHHTTPHLRRISRRHKAYGSDSLLST